MSTSEFKCKCAKEWCEHAIQRLGIDICDSIAAKSEPITIPRAELQLTLEALGDALPVLSPGSGQQLKVGVALALLYRALGMEREP